LSTNVAITPEKITPTAPAKGKEKKKKTSSPKQKTKDHPTAPACKFMYTYTGRRTSVVFFKGKTGR
jgi:hypothetical protein